LLKCMGRAERWNAILLVDEADVYIHPRGNDIQQNAIVGVFLRVLEYYNGVMFMTTNRPDLVDDAIASRCIARLQYNVPSIPDQQKIWAIQSGMNKLALAPKDLKAIAEAHPELSGRDVKNLLKLALLFMKARKEKFTPKLVDYVKRFKPTMDLEG
jgi:AAA+ superfamily predicted ATPase